jgi:hypothetical protein
VTLGSLDLALVLIALLYQTAELACTGMIHVSGANLLESARNGEHL